MILMSHHKLTFYAVYSFNNNLMLSTAYFQKFNNEKDWK